MFVGVVVLPRPSKDPPKMMEPFELLVMDVTGPLNPAKGRFVHPDDQAIAFVELPPVKLPPT